MVKFIINYYYLLHESFSLQSQLIVFHRSINDSKSPQVSRTLLNILAVHDNIVDWMASALPLISKSSSPFNNLFRDCTKSTNHNSRNSHFLFHRLFNFLAICRYVSFFSISFNFLLWSAETEKLTILQILFFFVDYDRV